MSGYRDDQGRDLGFDPFGHHFTAPICPSCGKSGVLCEKLSSGNVNCVCMNCDWAYLVRVDQGQQKVKPAKPAEVKESVMAEKTCRVEGCKGEVRSRGYCVKHYCRWQNAGRPDGDAEAKWIADGALSKRAAWKAANGESSPASTTTTAPAKPRKAKADTNGHAPTPTATPRHQRPITDSPGSPRSACPTWSRPCWSA